MTNASYWSSIASVRWFESPLHKTVLIVVGNFHPCIQWRKLCFSEHIQYTTINQSIGLLWHSRFFKALFCSAAEGLLGTALFLMSGLWWCWQQDWGLQKLWAALQQLSYCRFVGLLRITSCEPNCRDRYLLIGCVNSFGVDKKRKKEKWEVLIQIFKDTWISPWGNHCASQSILQLKITPKNYQFLIQSNNNYTNKLAFLALIWKYCNTRNFDFCGVLVIRVTFVSLPFTE